jgi:hypothetical protein
MQPMSRAERQRLFDRYHQVQEKLRELIGLPVEERRTKRIKAQIDSLQCESTRLITRALMTTD